MGQGSQWAAAMGYQKRCNGFRICRSASIIKHFGGVADFHRRPLEVRNTLSPFDAQSRTTRVP